MILVVKVFQSEFNQKLLQNTLNRNLLDIGISKIIVFTDSKYKSNNKRIIVINSLTTDSNCVEEVIKLFPNKIIIWSHWDIIFNKNL